jgi:hypothetical protein
MAKISFLEVLTKWSSVLNSARTTVGKDPIKKDPSSMWKKKILLAEHSPIRLLIVNWQWTNIKYWVSVHFVRHKIGIEHFVKTQRTDRTGKSRDDIPQLAPVNHECTANAQAIINISRKRLCSQASKETREAWEMFLNGLSTHEPELVSVCVRECIYRGSCYELTPCGYSDTEDYQNKLKKYRSLGI